MPPQAPDKWDNVRQCHHFWTSGNAKNSQDWEGQGDYEFGFQFNREPMDEKECLVLNVWTQGINDGKNARSGYGFMVVVILQVQQTNSLSLMDVHWLAKGDIVVVTVNHRLNVLGYTDLRGLGGKYSESVNLGQQDLVAALQWYTIILKILEAIQIP